MASEPRTRLRDLLDRFRETPGVRKVRRALRDGSTFTAGGLWGASHAFLLAALRPRHGALPTLVLAPGEEEADALARDLAVFLSDPAVARVFPALDLYDDAPALIDYDGLASRLLTLQRLLDGEAPAFLVASAAAVLQPVPAPEDLSQARRRIAVGDRLNLGSLAGELNAAGFKRTPMVEAPGEFAVRGGILDVFPHSRESPYRVELFDVEVDSIRQFEPASQRSLATVTGFSITLLPAEKVARPRPGASLTDYMPRGHLLVTLEEQRIREWVSTLSSRRAGSGLQRRLTALFGGVRAAAHLKLTDRPVPAKEDGIALPVRSVSGTARGLDDLEPLLADLADQSRLILLFGNNDAEAARLRSLAGELDYPGAEKVEVQVGRLSGSFKLPDIGFTFLSHDQVFDRYRQQRRPRHIRSLPVQDFVDLRSGDHVVHLAHGIGIYRGLSRLEKRGETEEFLKVEFADSVVVYVPVSKASLIQKYVGAREFKPRLSKVGGGTWERQKDRVRDAVKDLAAELLEIQAVRAAKPGIAYPADDRMTQEFEASFLYEDTPDQIDVGAAIKKDMELPRPMDRLLCGDVGYGKTELAIRAAFKAVSAGKQVAVLVPTTVLAQQHYQTFSERLVDYPVLVEMISRFRSKKEQGKIVERTAEGLVDILIGTHRLLSADVAFRDLGLVIVDEEQRFGVAHKTRLRHLRRTVDVLTMTATPIPRTLHMSLLGIKDISTLSTAPPGRQAIRTEVVEFKESLIRRGILREMNRGGQVFFVHNRVETIDRMAHRIQSIVPEARIITVHGQMNERELERGMLAFIRKKVDVLVTTTIIESGLDIPNANTIFLDRADRFGLAEMHQLRGRVGRYRHRAHCYLILPKRRVSTVAEKRIRAIEEFQELGAGFRIAMRDLEIRGAGNILGPQQSGHIAAVGYELYCRLLEEAVGALKDGTPDDFVDPHVELEVGARLPRDYVADEKQRIEIYQKLSRAACDDDLLAVMAESEDRFGPLPEEAKLLVKVARVRIAAGRLTVEHVVRPEPDRVLMRPKDAHPLLAQLEPIRHRVRIVDPRTVHLLLRDPAETGGDLLDDLLDALGGDSPSGGMP